MEHFETSWTMDMNTYMDTFRELGRHAVPREEQLSIVKRQIACLMIAVGSVIVFLVANNDMRWMFFPLALFGFLSAIIVPLQHKKQFKHITKANFVRQLETTGGALELELITSFTSDKIKIYNSTTNNTAYVDYNLIVRYTETEKLYVLFTKENQSIIVNKISIVQRGEAEEFSRFIREKCKNVVG